MYIINTRIVRVDVVDGKLYNPCTLAICAYIILYIGVPNPKTTLLNAIIIDSYNIWYVIICLWCHARVYNNIRICVLYYAPLNNSIVIAAAARKITLVIRFVCIRNVRVKWWKRRAVLMRYRYLILAPVYYNY